MSSSYLSFPSFSHFHPITTRSLSILFILQEFLSFCQLTETSVNCASEEPHIMNMQLETFFLSSFDNCCTQKRGIFDKLCLYSEVLLQASNIDDQTPLV